MCIWSKALPAIFSLGIVGLLGGAGTQAQTTITGSPSIALKSGESTEVTDVYWIINCRSVLKSTPEIEILDGPPGVTASIKEAMVIPRFQHCANRVKGGKLVIAAKEIQDPSYTTLTIRFTFRTEDGDRKVSQIYNLSLFP